MDLNGGTGTWDKVWRSALWVSCMARLDEAKWYRLHLEDMENKR